ncbi:MAG: hypothetical protein JO092_08890, partial [Candidatus Eremiobacteraeota bacterium]|nr:hypothetical protein [Candidatus Eremiobacteraeota bacterium]
MKRFTTLLSIVGALVTGASCSSRMSLPPSASPAMAQVRDGSVPAKAHRASYIYFAGNASDSSGGYGPALLGVYPATANGNVAPLHLLVGSLTGFVSPQIAWIDGADNRILTCDFNTDYASFFSTSHWGNVAPVATLKISPPLNSCGGIAMTAAGNVIASGFNNNKVATWAAGATGSAKASSVIRGHRTGIERPSEIAIDAAGDYVLGVGSDPGGIEVFRPDAGKDTKPLRVVSGSRTKLENPYAVAFDAKDNLIYVANEFSNSITAYEASANGNAAPAVFIHGRKTQINNPYGVAIDAAGYLYVGNGPQQTPH